MNPPTTPFDIDVGVIGGAGHVGLPLAITFAETRLQTAIYDLNAPVNQLIRDGRMPFIEHGGEEILRRVLAANTLTIHDGPEILSRARFAVLIIGTPVDKHLSPDFGQLLRAIDTCIPHFREGQTLVLRSTVFPGMSRHIQQYLHDRNVQIDVVFAPERVAEGYSIKEFKELPQIISGFDPAAIARTMELFSRFTPEFVEMLPMEAELAKLMTNAWRYIQFATVNQFYMIATEHDLDFNRILHGCRHHYPRMSGMPGPGFAAGPCLVKDTMQLAAFSQNTFALGHAAMLINEGLPAFLIEHAKGKTDLRTKTVGILGMAFKAESDDPRDSLAYKLKKLLTLEARKVLCTDPYVPDSLLTPLDTLMQQADVLFVSTPHKAYRTLTPRPSQIVIDVWNCLPK